MAAPAQRYGYDVVTRLLHWLTVMLLLAQFAVGYGMGTVSEWISGTDDSDADESAVFAHAWLGAAILVLATVRLLWRQIAGLPPWAAQLTERDRRLAHRTEQLLYVLLFVIPVTGLALLFVSGEERDVAVDREWHPPSALVDDDLLLSAHVLSHIALYLLLVFHIGLAVRRRTLTRMMWGSPRRPGA